MSRREMDQRGWSQCDVILVTGDAYVDHPSFGAALIGRCLEAQGYRVGVIAAPDPNDVEAFRVLGPPRLFWGVTAGNLDSQLARLTVMRKRRRDDPYLPEGQGDLRPPNATIVYVTKVRQAFKERLQESEGRIQTPDSRMKHHPIPVIIGGIEASLRRFPYYDYWTDSIKRSILFDSKADLLVYGMGERAITEVAARLNQGQSMAGIPGTAIISKSQISDLKSQSPNLTSHISQLTSYESISAPTPEGQIAFNTMTREILLDAATDTHQTFVQAHGDRQLVVFPPASPLDTNELDALYALPFTRKPHPAYAGKRIAAYDMIKDSVTTHRGCYGSCAFCAIAAHQGKTIRSRSRKGILAEIQHLTKSPDFHGTISDLGGPTANMYGTSCRRQGANCKRPSCLTPEICPNLITDVKPQLELLRAARTLPGVNHVFITSGIRFDLALAQDSSGFIGELARHHVCGRLKIAPEHINANVLRLMRKPGVQHYRSFVQRFKEADRAAGKTQQVIDYFVSGHPGCTLADMIELALYLKKEKIRPEQVQDFYPAPLTVAAAMFYTGHDPITGAAVYVAKTDNDKAMQRALLLCHDPKFHRKAREALQVAGREDLIKVLGC
jgi:uncharacterized radical SAM protein YgiQ